MAQMPAVDSAFLTDKDFWHKVFLNIADKQMQKERESLKTLVST